MKKLTHFLFVTASLLLLSTLSTSFAAQAIHPKSLPPSIGTDSPAVRTGNLVFLSGQGAISPKTGKVVEGGIQNQIKQTFDNLRIVAKAAGGDLNHIVKLNVYMTNLSDFRYLNKAMTQFFKKPFPARSTVGIKSLPLNQQIEIDAIMEVKGDKR